MRLDLLAALAGVLIAFQSRANGELSHRLGNGLEAALISFGSGLLIIILISLFHPGIKRGAIKVRAAVHSGELPRWRLFAGVLGASFVAVQTQIVPLVGVAIFSVAAIAGQTAASLLVDRIGLTAGGKKAITGRRVIAALITMAAVLVSLLDRLETHNLSIFAVLLAAGAGAIVGIQRALNGQINEFSGQSFTTTLFNFITGATFLLLLLSIGLLTHHAHLNALVSGPWWMYSGGAIGVLYIAFASTIVQHLGVLTFTLFTVGGQLAGSLLVDFFIPSPGTHITSFLIIGIAMTYLGVVVGGVKISRRVAK